MLELKDISYYPDGVKESEAILKDINLILEDNHFYVITGPNGGGKSSLAKIIMGIYRPTSGRIYLDGEDITELGITERARRGIGYAFQQPPRFKGITVEELLRLSARKLAQKQDREQEEKQEQRQEQNPGIGVTCTGCNYLFDVGLCPKDYVQREVNASLSGGELKRIEIASLLSREECRLAVFDEPEAGIDLWSFNRLTEIFEKVKRKKDMTTVIISHQEKVIKLADEIILIAAGRIQEKEDKAFFLESIFDSCSCRQECQERV
ncbi:MAG: ABC transporter ATP-binding protein [Peptococcia bacterium]|jgi:Fe-S cluster assembly ATP-binding protein